MYVTYASKAGCPFSTSSYLGFVFALHSPKWYVADHIYQQHNMYNYTGLIRRCISIIDPLSEGSMISMM